MLQFFTLASGLSSRAIAACSMAFEILYSDEAVTDMKKLRGYDRTAIIGQIEQILTVNPALESKAKVKRLRELAPTRYRLRVGEYRIFYDVEGQTVSIVRILSKEAAINYLRG